MDRILDFKKPYKKLKKILITGTGGFIGHFLFQRLNNKKFKVYGTINKKIDNRHKKIKKKLIVTKRFSEKKNIIKVDLSDLKSVKILFNKIKPEIVYHFAAFANHSLSEKEKYLCKKMNVQITNNILKCIRKQSKMIYLSTDKIYTRNPEKSPEHTRLNPLGFLAKQKLICEKLIQKKIKRHFILRLPIVH